MHFIPQLPPRSGTLIAVLVTRAPDSVVAQDSRIVAPPTLRGLPQKNIDNGREKKGPERWKVRRRKSRSRSSCDGGSG